jgi:hypothetical protein
MSRRGLLSVLLAVIGRALAADCLKISAEIEKALCQGDLHDADVRLNEIFAAFRNILPDASATSLHYVERKSYVLPLERDAVTHSDASEEARWCSCFRYGSPTVGRDFIIGDRKLTVVAKMIGPNRGYVQQLVYNDTLILEAHEKMACRSRVNDAVPSPQGNDRRPPALPVRSRPVRGSACFIRPAASTGPHGRREGRAYRLHAPPLLPVCFPASPGS